MDKRVRQTLPRLVQFKVLDIRHMIGPGIVAQAVARTIS